MSLPRAVNRSGLSHNQKLRVYDRQVKTIAITSQTEKKPATQPKVNQEASKNKENTPVAKVESSVAVKADKLLPEACGGEKHYKRALARIEELHPVYQPYVIKLINTGYQKLGICWTITDGYRSPEAQGALSGGVTNAGPLQSYHQYGLAIDIWSVRDGEIVAYNPSLNKNAREKLANEDHRKLGPIGEQLGLEWGGHWTSFQDYPHFEIHPNGKKWRDLKPQLIKLGITNYKKITF
ncbi:hypothetical protein A7A69_09905 [Acinetobacter sp. Ac_1271]|nr:hypothetical protein [Acinetobacter guerrae]